MEIPGVHEYAKVCFIIYSFIFLGSLYILCVNYKQQVKEIESCSVLFFVSIRFLH